MKVIPVAHGLETIVGQSGPRSGGLHISSVYNSLYQDLEPDRYKRGSLPDPVLLEMGLSCEQWMEDGLKNRLMSGWERPGELEGEIDERPVAYNPDLLHINGILRLGEIKYTQLSCKDMPEEEANNLPPKFSKYICQMQAYGHLMETPYARLIVFFANGNYNRVRGGDPQLRAWDFEFTAREIAENWSALVTHGRSKKWTFDHE